MHQYFCLNLQITVKRITHSSRQFAEWENEFLNNSVLLIINDFIHWLQLCGNKKVSVTIKYYQLYYDLEIYIFSKQEKVQLWGYESSWRVESSAQTDKSSGPNVHFRLSYFWTKGAQVSLLVEPHSSVYVDEWTLKKDSKLGRTQYSSICWWFESIKGVWTKRQVSGKSSRRQNRDETDRLSGASNISHLFLPQISDCQKVDPHPGLLPNWTLQKLKLGLCKRAAQCTKLL